MTEIDGGFINHNWKQLYIQLAVSLCGAVFSFAGTLVILYAMQYLSKLVPLLSLRATPDEEDLGMDEVEIGEYAVSNLDAASFLSEQRKLM